jgi:hypothetical protein
MYDQWQLLIFIAAIALPSFICFVRTLNPDHPKHAERLAAARRAWNIPND